MTKDVLISTQGLQFTGDEVDEVVNDEELDKIETICTGEYYYRNNAHFIMYDEIVDSALSTDSEKETVKNVIKLRDKEFVLTKKGIINVQMVFTQGKKTMTQYSTPFGNILIGIDTKSVKYEAGADSLCIHIDYGLEANYQFIADCFITIDVKSKIPVS